MSNICNKCQKAEPEVRLKQCAKCSTTPYCSRDCQKADWKAHKHICGKQAGEHAAAKPDPDLNPPKGLEKPVAKPFTRLSKNTWLHDRSETDVYRLLIDSYRLRIDDLHNIEGMKDEDSLYSGAENGLVGFRRYLDLLAVHSELLPPWWNDEKRQECEKLGMDKSQWQSLHRKVSKSDIIGHYGDQRFPMQLRLLAETIRGCPVGGVSGAGMLKMMAGMEGGGSDGMHSSMMDMSTGTVVHNDR